MIQEYKFRVQREAEESKRKQIEADGIAAFQKTVSQGISDSYLRWRGIEATLELAKSPNSKIVVIGSGKDGLPIILNGADNPVGAAGRKSAIGREWREQRTGDARSAGPRSRNAWLWRVAARKWWNFAESRRAVRRMTPRPTAPMRVRTWPPKSPTPRPRRDRSMCPAFARSCRGSPAPCRLARM